MADKARDGLLRFLMALVEGDDGAALPITLHVNGMMVTGSLVSGLVYLRGFGEVFTSSMLCRHPDRSVFVSRGLPG